MLSAARAWALFKLFRIFIFALSTLACIVWTALYILLLTPGWSSFTVNQRAAVLILILIYGISSIFLYLMIVVLFQPWMDGVRVAFLVLFQAGGSAAFFPLRRSLLCHDISPGFTCETMENIVIFGGWSLSGLLLIYAFFLGIMSFVPVPAPRPDPEAVLALNLGKEISLAKEKEKRQSTISIDSRNFRPSFLQAVPALAGANRGPPIVTSARMGPNYYRTGTPASIHSMVPSIHYPTDVSRAPSITSLGRMSFDYNSRPESPGSVSIHSTMTASSSMQSLTNPKYNDNYPSRVTSPAISIRSALSVNNGRPPNEPISRQGTPLSVVSYQVPLVPGEQPPRSMTPLGLIPGVRGLNTSQPSLTSSQPLTFVATPSLVQPFSATIPLRGPPLEVHPPLPRARGRMSSRSGSVSSVPRSLSPQSLSFSAPIPATPMAALLPVHPGLPKGLYHGRRGVHQVRRHGSVPGISVNDAPAYADSHHRSVSDYRGVSSNNLRRQ